jgi:hypothetical protein
MSREIMLAILEEELNVDENKPIQPLTETPAKVYKPKNLTEAEDEIQEKETTEEDKDEEYREEHNPEDESEETPDETVDSIGDMNNSDEELDDKLMKFTVYQLLTTQFLKMEYGTPSGSDSFCPTCGTEDAADAAIIDNEISPAKRTEPFGSTDGSSGGSDFGSSSSDSGGEDDDDFGMDFSFYYKQRVALEHCIPGTENFVRTFTGLFKFGEKIFHTVAQQFTRLTRLVLRIGEHNLVKVRYMAKFYQFKFSKLLNFIDDEALAKINIEVWKADDWSKIKDSCHVIYKLLTDMENQLAVKSGKFKDVKANYEKAFSKIKVSITDTESKNNTHDLYKLREGGSLAELGYSKENVVRMFRQLEELGEIVGMEAMGKINAALKESMLHIKTETARIKTLQETKPNDAKLKQEMDTLTAYNLRYTYLSNCANTYAMITDQLTTDLYKISKAFETSIIPEYVR